ncbi:unnamed protein product [Didymodactylos carnosus]|uniref:Palmitoyl-protein thioesterase 1 n=1 Tax=Didymodactylos carnosus TaxID=1234261 RepID=A0A815NG47_9BILA|nr:unnamed protein product [Didymodactylos carnosus]CAF1432728.1 unnamed protein product [Didymodactylos carnosus]CAF3789461.1 unnamed protein product [Didymodactylos carnosus]CAF4310999.1 unnamed protein product [Didymodactylos carnosus]
MHGVTATAADMNELAGWLTTAFPGIYVISIEIGNGYDDSFLLPLNKQVELFCATILADAHLRQGFNMLGVSQGSLIVRGAVERCSLPVYNLITLVGAHQGVFGIPGLKLLPAEFRELVSKYAYEEPVQNVISVAGFWRDPFRLDEYTNRCHFLPDINNERQVRNETYRMNMLKLNAFVMTYSDIDEVITPPQSGWFMGYAPQSLDVEIWNQSRQFTEDLIGMRSLWEQGKLHLFTSHTKHADSQHAPSKEFFFQNILPFFNNTLP